MNLSVVMPVYNAVGTIPRSIASFQKLSNLTDINCKLYVIDDSSTDGTLDKVTELSKLDSSIIVIKNGSNIGPGLSRNKALKKIRSGYVGFLDADDEILPERYVVSLMEGIEKKADWITFNGWFCKGDNKSEKYDFNRLIDNTKQLSIKCIRGELDGSVIFSIYSTKLIHENKLYFPSGYYEDIPFSYRAMLLAENRHISQEFAYKKHNVESSIVNTVSKEHITGFISSSVQVIEYLKSYGLLNYDKSESDKFYGVYGYIANLIRSIILCDISDDYRLELFNELYVKVNSVFDLRHWDYQVVTNKDKLVQYFFQNYPHAGDSFLEEIKKYYHILFNEHT